MSGGMQSFQLSSPVDFETKRELRRKIVNILDELEELPQVKDEAEEEMVTDNETQNKLGELLAIHREAAASKKPKWKEKIVDVVIGAIVTLAIALFSFLILNRIEVLDQRVYNLANTIGNTNESSIDRPVIDVLEDILTILEDSK